MQSRLRALATPLKLAALGGLLLPSAAGAHHGASPCLSGHGPTGDPPHGVIEVRILSVDPNSDMEGDDDLVPFYDNKADLYGRVTIAGEVHDLPRIEDDDSPIWDNHPPDADHPRGGVFRTQVTVMPDPDGLTALPVPISITIMESDGGLTGDDDVVDVSPAPDDTTLDIEFDLCDLSVAGDFSSNGVQSRLVVPAGDDKNDAKLVFTVGLMDGRPLSVDDIALMNLDLIQVLPNVNQLAAEKPTVVRVQVANNYDFVVSTGIEVRLTGVEPLAIVDNFPLPSLGPGEVRVVYLNLDDPYRFPRRPEPYTVRVTATVDPGQTLPDTGHAKPEDCRSRNNGANIRPAWKVFPMHRPQLVWTKVGADLDIGNFVPDSHFDEIVRLGEGYIRGIYPVDDIDQSKSPVDLPLFVAPGLDWLKQILPGTDVVDPFLMVANLSVISAVLGIERTMGVLPNKDWFERFTKWEDVTGLSMGVNFPRAVIFLPRMGEPGDVGPAMTLPAHELGHTYRLSRDTKIKDDFACNLEPKIFDLLCGALKGFDEYENNDEPYSSGNPTNGVWLVQGGETEEIVDLLEAEPEQCDSHCFMGSNLENDWLPANWDSRGRWIDASDYAALFRKLVDAPTGESFGEELPLIHVAGMIALEGDYYFGERSISIAETDAFVLATDILPAGARRLGPDVFPPEAPQVGEVRFVDREGVVLGSGPIPFDLPVAEADGAGDGVPLPVVAFGLLYPFPRQTAEIQVAVLAEDDRRNVVARVAVSDHAPEIELLPPRQGEYGSLGLAWRAEDADGDRLTYTVAVGPVRGGHWWPVRHGLEETSYEIDTRSLEPGSYRAMVVASDGVHSTESGSQAFSVRR